MDKKYMAIIAMALLAVPIAMAHNNNGRGFGVNAFGRMHDFDDDDNDINDIDDDFGEQHGMNVNNANALMMNPGLHKGWFKHSMLRGATITNQTVNGTTYKVITNNRNVTTSTYTGTQSFEAWINTDTGKIKSVDFEFHVDEVAP